MSERLHYSRNHNGRMILTGVATCIVFDANEESALRRWLAEDPQPGVEAVKEAVPRETLEKLLRSGTRVYADISIDEQTGWWLFLRISIPAMEAQIAQCQPGSESNGIALTKSSVKTRGDVRRLCLALGVELRERKAGE